MYTAYIDIIISMREMFINVIHYWFYIILLHNTATIDLGCGIADGIMMSLYIIWLYRYASLLIY